MSASVHAAEYSSAAGGRDVCRGRGQRAGGSNNVTHYKSILL